MEITLEEYKRAYREVKKEKERLGFMVHLAVYIIVNIMLAVANLLYSPHDIWFIYPLFGWGIGIVMHYLFGIRWIDKFLENMEARAEYRARTKKMR